MEEMMRRLIACVLLPSCVTACMEWQVQQATPQQVLDQEEQPELVHVTLSDGSWVVLQRPEMSGDSLFGVVAEGEYRGRPLKQGYLTAVHMADVVQVAVEEKTVAGPLAGVVAVLGAAGYVQFLAWTKH